MEYTEARPGASVSRFVDCYWMLDHRAPHTGAVQRIVPDGCPELILNFAAPFEAWQGAWTRQPACFFAGQILGPFLVRPAGVARVLGIRFKPLGAYQLLGMPVCELTGCIIPMDQLAPRVARELARIDAPDFGAVDRALCRLAGARLQEDRLIAWVVQEILRTDGATDVGTLAVQTGLSRRQLERRFGTRVGMPPKLFCRIRRFQRVFPAMDQGMAWVEAALECGYYDQAHLIRDFREFSGETPAALLRDDADLARHFLRRVSRPSNTPFVPSL